MPLGGSRSTARYMCIASAGHIHPIRRQYASVPAGRCDVYVHRAAVYVHRGSQAIYIEFYVCFHTRLTYTSGASIICVWDEQGSCTGHTSVWPHSSAIFWFSTGVLWKSGKLGEFHDVKGTDYITNSVRCQGKVIILNKMKGESGRLVPVEKLASSSFFYGKMRYNRRAQSPVEKLAQALVAFSC